MAAAKTPKEKPLPKSLAACADLYHTVKEERLALDRRSAELKAEETRLKNHIIDNLPKSQASGIAGKLVRVQVVMKSRPEMQDWPAFYAGLVKEYNLHVKKKDGMQDGAFAFLNRAVSATAVKEAWEAGHEVPGVGRFDYPDLSVSKL